MEQQAGGEGRGSAAAGIAGTGFSREVVEQIAPAGAEPAWLRQRRLDAWEAYERIPMPASTDEDWRRTDIRGLNLDRFALAARPGFSAARVADLPEELRSALPGPESPGGLLVQYDAGTVYQDAGSELAAGGVIFTSLERAVRNYPDLVQRYLLADAVAPRDDKFAALNAALWSGGAFLYVPPNVQATVPAQSLFWLSGAGAGIFPRTLIAVDRGASISYVDRYLSPALPDQAFAAPVAEVYLGEGAAIDYVLIQQWGTTVFNFASQQQHGGRDSAFNSVVVALGSKLTKMFIDSRLEGEGASARVAGLVLADGSQHLDHATIQDHVAAHTTSNLLFKTALRGRSRSVYLGLIRIFRGADGCDAFQENRNLLLSPHAKADTVPKLEIEPSEVRCTHAATVGQVDEEQLFYMMSRGVSRTEAEQMIVDGFVQPVLDRLSDERVRARAQEVVRQRLTA